MNPSDSLVQQILYSEKQRPSSLSPTASHTRLYQSLCVSALLTVLDQGDVYDGNKSLAVAQSTQQPIRVCPAEHLHHVTFVETELPWLCGNMMT